MVVAFDVMVNAEYCKGCTYCVIFCPKGCLEIGEAFNSKGYRYPLFRKSEECSGCLSCARLCPDFAIEIYKEEED